MSGLHPCHHHRGPSRTATVHVEMQFLISFRLLRNITFWKFFPRTESSFRVYNFCVLNFVGQYPIKFATQPYLLHALIQSNSEDTVQWIRKCGNRLCSGILLHNSIFELPHIAHSSCCKNCAGNARNHLTLTVPCSHITEGKLNECMQICNE